MTQHYVGTKQIVAWEQDKDGKPGYAVKYPDGYTSWSPKDVFEAAYLPLGDIGRMPAHQQRVLAEKVQLDEKITKLSAFAQPTNEIFQKLSNLEAGRLVHQLFAMNEYSDILRQRIEAFSE